MQTRVLVYMCLCGNFVILGIPECIFFLEKILLITISLQTIYCYCLPLSGNLAKYQFTLSIPFTTDSLLVTTHCSEKRSPLRPNQQPRDQMRPCQLSLQYWRLRIWLSAWHTSIFYWLMMEARIRVSGCLYRFALNQFSENPYSRASVCRAAERLDNTLALAGFSVNFDWSDGFA